MKRLWLGISLATISTGILAQTGNQFVDGTLNNPLWRIVHSCNVVGGTLEEQTGSEWLYGSDCDLTFTEVAAPFGVPAQQIETPPVQIPKACTPGNVACVGPYTVPSQFVATNPIPLPTVRISLSIKNLALPVTLLGPIAPISLEIPTPFGPLPVTVCESTCVAPQAGVRGTVTVEVVVGSTTVSHTIPAN